MLLALSILGFVLALIPCALFVANLREYRVLAPADHSAAPKVSVLIPARDEEANIADALRSVLACTGVEIEVLVLDDHSTDRTGAIVHEIAAADARVRLVPGAELPPGWRGKNFACQQLAEHAVHPLLIFLDADVRITQPNALARLAQFMQRSEVALASGIPRQITVGWMERLIIPLIHFVLLGFLPLRRMRASPDPRCAAACGQLLAIRAADYRETGGHGAIAGSIHDAVALTRSFRASGLATDLFDATDSFSCRMYQRADDVWNGFVKNAHEGLGAPRLIGPATVVLLGGQVLPLFTLAASIAERSFGSIACSAAAVACLYLPRGLATARFSQSRVGAFFHPAGIVALVLIQWVGAFRHRAGKPVAWKGRTLAA